MSKPSGTSDQILNLPSGGGSISGSGSSFNVDLNTGTATTSFDLYAPIGPNGIKPSLKLVYAASSGDGAFGLGWSLGLLTIIQNVTPSADTPDPTVTGFYSLVGAGDLIDMGSGQFRPTVDTTGQLIQFASGSWSITDNTDTVCTLGTTANAQIGSPPAAWLLDGCTDSSGNAIRYSWTEDGAARYPGTVTWGTYQIIFSYEPRPDLVVNGQFGAPTTYSKRCNGIELHVTTEAQSLVRSWTLLYDDNGGRGRSQLITIREQGHAADGSTLQAPDHNYSYTVLGVPSFQPVTGFTQTLFDTNTDLVDLNGDGLPDFLHLGPVGPSMNPNMGGASFGYPRYFSRAPAYLSLSSPGVVFADMSGEGNVDLMVINQQLSGYYPLSVPQAGSAPSRFGFPVVFETSPPWFPDDARVRLLDLNGDGITDMLVDNGNEWMIYLREDTSHWSPAPRLLASNVTPAVQLTDPHIYLADMTGDRLMDIVRVDGGSVTFWPARADGGWGDAIPMFPSPAFNRNYVPSRMSLVDIDGDGCADLVYVDAYSVTVWRNVGAGQLADPIVISPTPYAQLGSYRIVDLLGSGTAGVLFELPALQAEVSRQTFLDFSGGSKPYLLSKYENGPSLTVQFTYRSSTGFAQDDAAAGSPWQTYHPFPVQCVSGTGQTDNATGNTVTTEYIYHDGRYDPATRTFLGFSRVETRQLGDVSCPTLSTVTTFHVGLDPSNPTQPLFGDEALKMQALRRRVLSTTTYGLDGSALQSKPYSVTSYTYDALLVPSTVDPTQKAAIPYGTSTTEERWDRSDTIVSTRLTEYLAVDPFGSITQQRTRATRTGVATPDQDVTTNITFATGGANLHLQARTTQTGPDGSVIAASVIYYDGDAFVGLPEGQATEGLTTRVENLAFNDAFIASIWPSSPPDFTQYGYHRLAGDSTGWWFTLRAHQRVAASGGTGPALLTKGSMGGVTKMQLDPTSQYVVALTDEAGNTTTATFDARVSQTASVTDANGNTSIDMFDSLGRVAATVGPEDTAALPLAIYTYAVGAVSQVAAAARVAHGAADVMTTMTWSGGVGEILGRGTPALTAGQWVISGAAAYNARGLASAAYLPYQTASVSWEAPSAGSIASAYVYDALGRVIQYTRPDGLVVTTSRSGSTVTISETWPAGAETVIEQQVLDAAGQMVSVSRNAGDHWVTQTYTYSPSGKLAGVTLPVGATITTVSDLLGRRFSQQSPDRGTTTFVVDAAGNERVTTNSVTQQVRTDIDIAGRITAIYHDAEATPRIQYQYLDQGGATPSDGITTNRYGRLWRITDELGTILQQYDEAARVVASQRTVSASSQVFGIQTAYDAIGRVINMTLPAASGATPRKVTYQYGVDGRLISAPGIIDNAVWDILGRLTTLSYANGATTSVTYRPDGGSTARVVVTDSSGASIRDTTVTQSEAFISGLTSAVAGDDSVSFSYDGLRRLTAANYSQGAANLDVHSWAFDDTFALTGTSETGALTYKAGTHQLASVGGQAVTFDAAGRMSQGRCGTMVFDSANRLTGITPAGGANEEHTYDYSGRRVLTTSSGAQSYFSPIAGIEIAGGTNVSWIYFGKLRVAADTGGALWFLHGNALGGTDLITDSAGHYATRTRQTPFCTPRPPSGAPASAVPAELAFLLIGADASGLICQGQRWYDPQTGQFISPDPIVTGVYLIGAWNPYAYCLDNPIALCDPTGLSLFDVLEDIFTAIVVAALVVAAVYTAGTSLLGAAAMVSAQGELTMVGVAIGSFGGAMAGETAAQKAGGSIILGAVFGGIIGGLTSILGGVIVPVQMTAGSVIPVTSYIASGLGQGAFAGLGTGLAIGFAGGKGDAGSMIVGMASGMAWGAVLGTILGAGIGFLVGGADPSRYIGVNFQLKYNDTTSWFTSANSADNVANVWQTLQSLAQPNGLNAGNFSGFGPELITNMPNPSPYLVGGVPLSVSIQWLPTAVLKASGFAVAIDLSMATDQLGFSYAQQFTALMGLAPLFIDFIYGEFQILDPKDFNNWQNWFNQKFGSGEAG